MANLNFQRELRIVTPRQYDNVFKNPLKASSPALTILACTNDLPHLRLGLIVPKKVLAKAVDRNRIKRLCRNFFRLHQHTAQPLDYVVIAKGGIRGMENSDVVALLEKLCTVISRRYKKQASGSSSSTRKPSAKSSEDAAASPQPAPNTPSRP